MKKLFYALMALVMGCGMAQAQKVKVIGLDGKTIISFKLDQIDKLVFLSDDGEEEIEAVDLGLSVKWANMNVGAEKSSDYGGYYAWGETSEKSEYNAGTYFNSDYTIQTDIAGTEYDVAHVKWGGSWRMPRQEEIKELVDNCTWQCTIVNGVEGRKVTGPNGNSIFLPAAGYRYNTGLNYDGYYGYYWSSTPYDANLCYAFYLNFYSSDGYWYTGDWRYLGYPVRAVME